MKDFIKAVRLVVVLTVVTGIIYPLVITGVTQGLFPKQANGSLLYSDGKVIGSQLIGQAFTGKQYFWPRPSMAGDNGYDSLASGGSNWAPTNKTLLETAQKRAIEFRQANSLGEQDKVAAEMVTASGSGLDPDIGVTAVYQQAERVAQARGLSREAVQKIIDANIIDKHLGVLGEKRINVLQLNLALDNSGYGS